MRIRWITYDMGTEECKLLCRLLRQHMARVERETHNGVGLVLSEAQRADYDTARDMYNQLIKQLSYGD